MTQANLGLTPRHRCPQCLQWAKTAGEETQGQSTAWHSVEQLQEITGVNRRHSESGGTAGKERQYHKTLSEQAQSQTSLP